MRKFLFYFCLLATILFTSCAKDFNVEETRETNYTASFMQSFGITRIPSSQTWGFDEAVNPYATATRAANVNGNQWKGWGYVIPPEITDSEIETVKATFANPIYENRSESVNWPNFWVQQVFKGTATYKDGFGNTLTGSDKMNLLTAFNPGTKEVITWWPEYKVETITGYDEHINNFNNGNNTTVYYSDGDNAKEHPMNGITLMLESSTQKFGYHNSIDSKQHYEYIVLKVGGSYYVGFDFYATHPEGQEANKNMDVERDYIYNDWVVKISPAYKEGEQPVVKTKRIIVEDIIAVNGGVASNSDFDFNDAVFDATFTNGGVHIKLLAAGGTKPLYIGSNYEFLNNKGHEVHELFGCASGSFPMVNTNAGPEKKAVEFDLTGTFNSYDDIIVWVLVNGIPVELKSNPGHAPSKMCVDTDYCWIVGESYSSNPMEAAFGELFKAYAETGVPNYLHREIELTFKWWLPYNSTYRNAESWYLK